MLEDILRCVHVKEYSFGEMLTDKFQPAVNTVFRPGGSVERYFLKVPQRWITRSHEKMYDFLKEKRETEEDGFFKYKMAGIFTNIVAGLATIGLYAGYTITEAAMRTTETIIRLCGKASYATLAMLDAPIKKKWNIKLKQGTDRFLEGIEYIDQSTRYSIMAGVSLIIPTYLGIAMMNSQKQRENLVEGALPLDPIAEFQGIDNILVYTANIRETNYVRETLEERDGSNDNNFQFQRSGPILEVRDENRIIHVVTAGDIIPRTRGGYDMIQLRGHTSDMEQLYRQAIGFRAEHTIVHLGGCDGRMFIEERADENTALLAGIGSQDGAMNTYLLLQVPPLLEESSSWDDFRQKLELSSERVRNELIVPGAPNYTATGRFLD